MTHGRIKRRATDKSPEEAAHMTKVAAMTCAVTGRRPVVVHHIMHMPGKRARRDHRYIVPLVPALHNMGDDSVHALGGEEAFKRKHGVDLVAWAVSAWEKSNG